MLKPLPEHDEQKAEYIVTDIENKPDGSVIAIDSCWRDVTDSIVHIQHENWGDYWGWILEAGTISEKFRTVYAHNGGGWDWLSLLEYLLSKDSKGKYLGFSCTTANSNLIILRVKICKGHTINFCDSLQLLRSSLDKLANKFVGESKVNFDYKTHLELYEKDREKFNEYLRADTELLLKVMENSLKLIRENVSKIDRWGYTIGSSAMKVFRTSFLDREIKIPEDPILKDYLREGYNGGRVECFRSGYFKHVKVYDINSLYPTVMKLTKVPVSDRGNWTRNYEPGLCGIFTVKFEQKNKTIPPVLLVGGVGAYEGEGTYYTPEIDLLTEVDPAAELQVKRGFVFADTCIIFDHFVNSLYSMRRKDSGGPLDLLCKYLLNSLYGKFGQKPEQETIVKVDSILDIFSIVSDGAKISPINEEKGIYASTEQSNVTHEHVGIAGTITSNSRVHLYRGLLAAGFDNIIYCDTDSVHTTSNLPKKLVGEKLGQFKLEFDGEGTYAGKKLYGLRNNRQEKIRAKGVSIGGDNGFKFGFDDMLRISSQGESLKTTFHRPATLKQVLKGKKPCQFQPKNRIVKSTV